MKITIINGPNLNLLGVREPQIYGYVAFEEYIDGLKAEFPQYEIVYEQSNVEGEIVTMLQRADNSVAILLNAGGYTHTSVAIHDCIKAIGIPVIEIHISQVAAREEFRRTSIVGAACRGTVSGFGLDSYRLGIVAVENLINL
ncbi:MAG: 3-dehydroquinate dehydratase [Bacteroidales bacterium]|jgi:3-dehydroquinate dehydratase-2|nr:3-dehydroquinate dehydratase [Bacteroidales bacterium]